MPNIFPTLGIIKVHILRWISWSNIGLVFLQKATMDIRNLPKIPKIEKKTIEHPPSALVSPEAFKLTVALQLVAELKEIGISLSPESEEFWNEYFPLALRLEFFPRPRWDNSEIAKCVEHISSISPEDRTELRIESLFWLGDFPEILEKVPFPVCAILYKFVWDDILRLENGEVVLGIDSEQPELISDLIELSLPLSEYGRELARQKQSGRILNTEENEQLPEFRSYSPEIISPSPERTLLLFSSFELSPLQTNPTDKAADSGMYSAEDENAPTSTGLTAGTSHENEDTSHDVICAEIDAEKNLTNAGLPVLASRFAPKAATKTAAAETPNKGCQQRMLRLMMALERIYIRRAGITDYFEAGINGKEKVIPPMWKLDCRVIRMADLPGLSVYTEEEKAVLLAKLEQELESHREEAQSASLSSLAAVMDYTMQKIQKELEELQETLPAETRDELVEDLRNRASEAVSKETKAPRTSLAMETESGGSSSAGRGGYQSWRGNDRGGYKRGTGFRGRGKRGLRHQPYPQPYQQ